LIFFRIFAHFSGHATHQIVLNEYRQKKTFQKNFFLKIEKFNFSQKGDFLKTRKIGAQQFFLKPIFFCQKQPSKID
jgi:hypothetical protein